MAVSLSTVARTAMMQAIITAAGATGARIKLYNGAIPPGVSAATGTLLATGFWNAGPIGVATAGTLDWNEAGMSQNAANHIAGTPTFAQVLTSADVVVARVDFGGAPWTFTGAIAVNQNFAVTGLVFTAGNP